tara:strand:+ start:451 stop:1176 length:726 start_codon:yes stop_codon:yes gene_type:complete
MSSCNSNNINQFHGASLLTDFRTDFDKALQNRWCEDSQPTLRKHYTSGDGPVTQNTCDYLRDVYNESSKSELNHESYIAPGPKIFKNMNMQFYLDNKCKNITTIQDRGDAQFYLHKQKCLNIPMYSDISCTEHVSIKDALYMKDVDGNTHVIPTYSDNNCTKHVSIKEGKFVKHSGNCHQIGSDSENTSCWPSTTPTAPMCIDNHCCEGCTGFFGECCQAWNIGKCAIGCFPQNGCQGQHG